MFIEYAMCHVHVMGFIISKHCTNKKSYFISQIFYFLQETNVLKRKAHKGQELMFTKNVWGKVLYYITGDESNLQTNKQLKQTSFQKQFKK